ncbi:hypothetical protein QC761_0100460 [Podospora bellae-mahoneyi]|uniref:Uncharacterized protein n=1 Tax=Podospora bellae-mahoneyi TaxID=2093777 RepID=A0ABR0FDU0_9PEZI|nr:hypothetical protein QC761_0100460 [Podospora bellae-mahoneyi]
MAWYAIKLRPNQERHPCCRIPSRPLYTPALSARRSLRPTPSRGGSCYTHKVSQAGVGFRGRL